MKELFKVVREMFKKKELLECPKTGMPGVDPDSNDSCAKCVRKFLAGRNR